MSITTESLTARRLAALSADVASVTVGEMRQFALQHGGAAGQALFRVIGQPVLEDVDYASLADAVDAEMAVRRAYADPAWLVWEAWAEALRLAVLARDIEDQLP